MQNQSRRTVLRVAAWSVPAVTVVAAAPAFAASTTRQLSVQVTRYSVVNDPASADYRLDVLVNGPMPATPRIQWLAGETGVHSLFENSSNLTPITADYTDQALWSLSGSSFWLRDTLNQTAVGSCSIELYDGGTRLEVLPVVYDGTLPAQPPPL